MTIARASRLKRWLAAALAACAGVGAPAHERLAALREEVLMLPGPGGVELEATLFRPPGDGPFPLVLVNHGKSRGDPRRQPRARYVGLAHELVQRGYAVAVPMRRGFSRSGGEYEPHPCDAERNGLAQADDVSAALDAVGARPDIDASRVVVVGQSFGGLTTLALGTRALERVAGLVNFAGGLREDFCTAWETGLTRAFAAYGRRARVPSLWFYGEEDPLFALPLARELHRHYTEGGADAALVAFAGFGADAHHLVDLPLGRSVWLPELQRFFVRLGLPFEPRHTIGLAAHDTPPPAVAAGPASGPAPPQLRGAGLRGYADFLAAERPRAFAIGADGSWAWHAASGDAMARALGACRLQAGAECRLYAVDDDVVWTSE